MDKVLDRIAEEAAKEAGLNRIARYYGELGKGEDRLVGYVMSLGYDDATLITNDFYKHRCGGVPKNSFLIVRPEPFELPGHSVKTPPHLVLVRVLEPASTPLSADVSRTYFEMHKSHMPEIDVFTRSELQWGAIKAAVLGTFYDSSDGKDVAFGADIETYYSPHLYAVFSPTAEMLDTLVNAFVDQDSRQCIGAVRLTEARLTDNLHVPVYVSPRDFVGARTALFGKTRMGKSNTVKVILQMTMDSGIDVGQIIFDLNGEYAYRNEQDRTCIYDLYSERCDRYSLRENPPEGVELLKANFYEDLSLGLDIMKGLYETEHGKPADYVRAFLEWEIPEEEAIKQLRNNDPGAWTRLQRNISIYKCVLHKAGFPAPAGVILDVHLKEDVRKVPNKPTADPSALDLPKASALYTRIWKHYDPDVAPFRTDGDAYFDPVAESLLTLLTGEKRNRTAVSGSLKLKAFLRYHSPNASDLLGGITKAIDDGRTVIIDLSNAPDELSRFYGELISRAVFKRQMDRFVSGRLGGHYVQFYFEEAHNLFPRDDKNLTGIYNRIAKEGAKLNMGMAYSTQSIASLSPDLLKNTENFFIAHLNDQNDISALTRFQEFRDVGADVQRTKAKGFVRMITSSHRFAIPVQIHKFGPAKDQMS